MKKSTPVRYLITILLLSIIFTSIPFIYAEPVDAADYSNAVVDAYRKDQDSFPKINLSGPNFTKINKEIWDKYYDNIVAKDKWDDYSVTYVWGRKDNVLSVVINEHYVNQSNTDTIYNLELPNGETLNTTQVLAAAGLSKDGFYKKVKQALGTHYKTVVWRDPLFYYQSIVDMYNKGLDETLSKKNVESARPYFNKKGELCFSGTIIGPPAGAGSYTVKLNLSTLKVASDYDKKASLQAYPIKISRAQADKLALKARGTGGSSVPNYKQGTKEFSYLYMAKGTGRYDNEMPQYRESKFFYEYERFYVYVTPPYLETGTPRYILVDANTGEVRVAYNLSVWNYVEQVNDFTKVTITGISNKTYTGSAISQSALTVKYNGRTLRQGTDYSVAYKNNKNVGTATVEVTGMGSYGGKVSRTFKITAKLPSNATRVYGSSRYATATKISDRIKSLNGNKKFEAVIVATGTNYPDALGGAYLAKSKNAPIVITSKAEEANTVKYISNNVAKSGTVYILGGAGAVSLGFEQKVRSGGRRVVRLGGKTRYETNIKILKEAGSLGSELIVVTGKNFPDALSASAAGKPILLVGDTLTNDQGKFVKNNNFSKITIVGGKGVVAEKIKTSLSKYGKVTRVYGSNRYETSSRVAQKYFRTAKNMVMAIGTNYPDALTGGPLAMKLKAPLILTSSNSKDYTYAKSYRKTAGVKKCYILGGPKLIDNQAAINIMK